ncbi:MAG TPA: T9SS type A sorting domain-containing protein, partial [Niastella sp.]
STDTYTEWSGNNPAGGHESSMPPGLANYYTAFFIGNIDNGKYRNPFTLTDCWTKLALRVYVPFWVTDGPGYFSWTFSNTPFAIDKTADETSFSYKPAAAILSDPLDTTRCKGISATFSATTANTTSLQWQQSTDAAFTNPTNLTNNSLYSGTTTNTLNIANNGTLGGLYFRLVAANTTNTCGSDTSKAALLSVTPLTTAAASTTCTQAATDNNYIYVNQSCELIARVAPAGGSPIAGNVTSRVWIENSVPTYAGQPFVARHYEITPASNTATSTGTVSLYFTQADFDAFNAAPGSTLKLPTGGTDNVGRSNLRIGAYTGNSNNGSGLPGSYTGNATVIIPTGVAWTAVGDRWIITFNAAGFGGFIVQTATTALPVNLIAFSGRLNNNDAHLQWKTTSETNNDYFEIERSFDGQTFTAIGRVAGNNGTTTQTYNFIDAGAAQLHSSKLFYRLKIVSTTGGIEYSNIVILSVSASGSPVITVTPNPFTTQVNINPDLPVAAQLTFTLSDITGKKLRSESINAPKGISTNSLTGLGNLVPGIYVLAVQYNGQTYTYKLVK